MARLLKQSTAFTFRIGPFLDSTDGVTAETGLSIGQADIQISKAGGAFGQTSASPTTTHDADGWYQCPLTTTDTGTLGTLTVQIVMAGALPVWEHFMVLPANVYDSLVAGSDALQVHANEITNNLITAAAIADGAIDAATFAAGAINAAAVADGAIDAATFAADVDAEVAAYVWNAATAGYGGAGTYGQASEDILADTNELQGDWVDSGRLDALIDAIKAKTDSLTFTVAGDVDCNVQTWKGAAAQDMTGDSFARLGAPAGASVSADIAAVKSDSAAILTDTGTTLDGKIDSILTDTGTTLEGHLTDIKGAGWTDENLTTIDANLDAVLVDTGTTLDGNITAILADTNELQGDWTDGGRLDLLLDACSTHSAADVWTATNATLSLAYGVIAERLYRFLMNKMIITDATGAVALRNEADGGDIATQTVTDDDTSTTRTALSWA